MEPGGTPVGEGAGDQAPARVIVVRMEPRCDLSRDEAQAWRDAAGPIYRLSVGEELTSVGHVIYGAYHAGSQLSAGCPLGGPELAAERLVGYLRLEVPPRRNYAWIRQVWVDLDRRRAGIGRSLLDEAVTTELDQQRAVLLALVPRANVQARSFFRAVGFMESASQRAEVVKHVLALPRSGS